MDLVLASDDVRGTVLANNGVPVDRLAVTGLQGHRDSHVVPHKDSLQFAL